MTLVGRWEAFAMQAEVQSQSSPCGICGKVALGQAFLQVFLFSPVNIIPSIFHSHSLSHPFITYILYTYSNRQHGFFFLVQCHHMFFVDFMVLPPGHGRSVTDFWGWNAHEAQLRCPNDVWVVTERDVVPGGALNLNSTNLPRPWSPQESSPSRKIPTVEPGIEPGTSWLVVRDSDH